MKPQMGREKVERASVHHPFQEHFGEKNMYFICHFLNKINNLFTFDFLKSLIKQEKLHTITFLLNKSHHYNIHP